ncbi:hypothetical protein HO173_010288 [Letharia columbiana]|uniref:Uncharacterized protein n=1 Tax=Letharia columbiana TaxID=112416 RepID=A0A8H6FN05_9LECA|nr:uncharacterized protein HO173_010288 [Letharia columbiana]KAF6231536.1 hypothetical protein HO173_010288 [Letharia columbiana]
MLAAAPRGPCGSPTGALGAPFKTERPTYLATQPEHSVKQEEESLQQANAENTAEKSSGSKAPSTKNAGLLSTIPRQVINQQMENTTTIWPAISTCLGNIALIWYIIELTTQEKDLLRRSQPNHYGQLGLFRTEFGRCIFGRIETA